MKVTDDDGTAMVECKHCGYFGDYKGRLMTECCNGSSGCSCGGREVDMGPCLVCHGTGWHRVDADTRANLNHVRAMAQMGRGYVGSGPSWGRIG